VVDGGVAGAVLSGVVAGGVVDGVAGVLFSHPIVPAIPSVASNINIAANLFISAPFPHLDAV